MPMPIPVPYSPTPMPTPVPECNVVPCCSCTNLQFAMEEVACNHTERSIQVCDSFSSCYEKQSTSWRSMHSKTCVGPNSTQETLKYELYIVLKIECLANALNLPDSTRDAGIQACAARNTSSFNLDAANIANCSQAEVPWQTDEYLPCVDMQDVANYTYCSGTSAFEAEYYKYVRQTQIINPRDCESECCIKPPTPHQAPTR